jgi:hypothetical protein
MASDDLLNQLAKLLPAAIAWAEQEAADGAKVGRKLTQAEEGLARRVGVAHPEQVRVALVGALPMPDTDALRAAANQVGMFGPEMAGLTLGHTVFMRRGDESVRLLSHELRHVHQYEQGGSIADFLPRYLLQVVQHGYASAPYEQDASAHETNVV